MIFSGVFQQVGFTKSKLLPEVHTLLVPESLIKVSSINFRFGHSVKLAHDEYKIKTNQLNDIKMFHHANSK